MDLNVLTQFVNIEKFKAAVISEIVQGQLVDKVVDAAAAEVKIILKKALAEALE